MAEGAAPSIRFACRRPRRRPRCGRRMRREWRGDAAAPAGAGLAAAGRAGGPARAMLRPADRAGRRAAAGRRLRAWAARRWRSAAAAILGGAPPPSRRFAAALHAFGWLPRPDRPRARPARARRLRLWLEWRARVRPLQRVRLVGRRRWSGGCSTWPARPASSRRWSPTSRARPTSTAWRGRPGICSARRTIPAARPSAPRRLRWSAPRSTGRPGEALRRRALPRLAGADPRGGAAGRRATRAARRSAGLELLFDLIALDDALSQLGAPSPPEVSRAIDRLAAATRFFALADGRLAAFQGGEPGRRADVAAARALDAGGGEIPRAAPYGGYHRLEGGPLQLIVDAGAPAAGRFAGTACVQPGAHHRRLRGAAADRRLGLVGEGGGRRRAARPGGRLMPGAGRRAPGDRAAPRPARAGRAGAAGEQARRGRRRAPSGGRRDLARHQPRRLAGLRPARDGSMLDAAARRAARRGRADADRPAAVRACALHDPLHPRAGRGGAGGGRRQERRAAADRARAAGGCAATPRRRGSRRARSSRTARLAPRKC